MPVTPRRTLRKEHKSPDRYVAEPASGRLTDTPRSGTRVMSASPDRSGHSRSRSRSPARKTSSAKGKSNRGRSKSRSPSPAAATSTSSSVRRARTFSPSETPAVVGRPPIGSAARRFHDEQEEQEEQEEEEERSRSASGSESEEVEIETGASASTLEVTVTHREAAGGASAASAASAGEGAVSGDEEGEGRDDVDENTVVKSEFNDGGFVEFAQEITTRAVSTTFALFVYLVAVIVILSSVFWVADTPSNAAFFGIEKHFNLSADSVFPIVSGEVYRKLGARIPGVIDFQIPPIYPFIFTINKHAERTGTNFFEVVKNNVLLMLFVAAAHGFLARPEFATYISKVLPARMVRSLYVFIVSIFVMFMQVNWIPMTNNVWTVAEGNYKTATDYVFYFGVLLAFASTFFNNHFSLFGVSQGCSSHSGDSFPNTGIYALMRHPIASGIMLSLWSASHMTEGRLLFAAFFTLYAIVYSKWQDQENKSEYGEEYEEYMEKVPAFVPSMIVNEND